MQSLGGRFNCGGCPPSRQERWGCKPGTEAKEKGAFGGLPGNITRCPTAILRDLPAETKLWIEWAQRWYFAKESHSLSVYLKKPSMRVMDLIDIVESEILAIREEKRKQSEARGR